MKIIEVIDEGKAGLAIKGIKSLFKKGAVKGADEAAKSGKALQAFKTLGHMSLDAKFMEFLWGMDCAYQIGDYFLEKSKLDKQLAANPPTITQEKYNEALRTLKGTKLLAVFAPIVAMWVLNKTKLSILYKWFPWLVGHFFPRVAVAIKRIPQAAIFAFLATAAGQKWLTEFLGAAVTDDAGALVELGQQLVTTGQTQVAATPANATTGGQAANPDVAASSSTPASQTSDTGNITPAYDSNLKDMGWARSNKYMGVGGGTASPVGLNDPLLKKSK